MNSGIKKLPIFLSTIFLIFSCLIFVFLYEEIGKNKKIAEEIESKWQIEDMRRKEMKTLDNTVKMIEGEKQQLDIHFATSGNVVPFLNTLEGLADDAGAEAQVTSVDILKENKGLLVVLKANGSFESLYKLLRLFENSPYALEILGVDMQKLVGGDENSALVKWESNYKIKLISFVP